MRKNIIYILLLMSLIYLNSCGLMFHKVRKSVYVDSNPQNAEIYINDSLVGVTPTELDLRKYNYQVTLELKKENYVNDKIMLISETNNLQQFADILFYAIPYFVNDYVGNDYETFKFPYNMVNLRNIDSLKAINEPIESKLSNVYEEYYNQITKFDNKNNSTLQTQFLVEGLPGFFLTTSYLSFVISNHTEFFDLYTKHDSRVGLGLRSGYGWAGFGSGEYLYKTSGYFVLPTINYESVRSLGQTMTLSVGVGQSFISEYEEDLVLNKNYKEPIDGELPTEPEYIREKINSKSQPISILYSGIYKDYTRNIILSATVGYLNKLNYIQFGFGLFIY